MCLPHRLEFAVIGRVGGAQQEKLMESCAGLEIDRGAERTTPLQFQHFCFKESLVEETQLSILQQFDVEFN